MRFEGASRQEKPCPSSSSRRCSRSGEDTTPYRKLTSDFVGTAKFNGKDVLTVEPEALTLLTAAGLPATSPTCCARAISQQLRNILDDAEASSNDQFVALELLKNANIAAGGVLPMCQDTGTAIVMGKKGQAVWTGGGDEAAIAKGVYKTYTETNLRYIQVAPLSMFKEVKTGTNLPAQIDIYRDRRRRLQIPVRRQGRRLGQQELPATSRRRRC